MKKLLLSLVWIVATFALSAQTYREYETTHGKNYLIKDKNGKYTSVQCSKPTGNMKLDNPFLSSNFQKEDARPLSVTSNPKDRPTHHLALKMDQTIFAVGADIYISSNLNIFDISSITWSEDGLKGDIDLPENNYEIIAAYNAYSYSENDPAYVIIHNINISSDTSIEINFATMANHKIYLQYKDENGVVIDPTSQSVLFNNATISISLPENHLMTGLRSQIRVPNGYIMASDIDSGYKILLNQLYVQTGKLYIADMGEIEGLASDTILQNNYPNYKKMDMVFHTTPSSPSDNHLAFQYGTIDDIDWWYVIGSGWGFNGEYISFDRDTLHVFTDNRKKEVSGGRKITCLASVCFYEGSNSMISDPFFVNTNDSIAFAKFNVTAASPQFPDNGIVDLGITAPFNKIIFYNSKNYNVIDLSPNELFLGQLHEERQMDNHFSIYEIKKGSEVLVSDTLSNFTEPFSITEQGIYNFTITNKNYAIKDQPGQSTFEASFDMGNEDANPPVISSFKLLDSENSITNSFESDKPGSILLNAYDYNFSTHMLNRPASVQVFYKKFEDTDWTELNTVEYPNLFDPFDLGAFYKCNLSSVFAQFITSGYLDLKIVSADNAGNTITQILHPACEVINNATTPILSVTPVNQNVTAEEGTTQFNISNTGIGTMNYTAEVTSGTDWLTIVDGGSGSNSGILTLHYEVNNTSSPRVGTITVSAPGATGSPVNVTVTQTNIHVPTLTITHVENIVPGPVTIPVHAANVTNMGSFQFTINFDPSILTYDSVSNWYTGIDAVTVGNPSSGHLTFVWAADAEGINIPNGKFFDLNFNWLTSDGISTNLTWGDDPTPREFADYDGNIFVPDYVNGVEGGFGVGIPEMGSSFVKIFPNPAANIVNITVSNTISAVQVMNYLGMVVHSENIAQEKTITLNTSRYSAGNYLVRFVTNSGQTLIKKMVIIK